MMCPCNGICDNEKHIGYHNVAATVTAPIYICVGNETNFISLDWLKKMCVEHDRLNRRDVNSPLDYDGQNIYEFVVNKLGKEYKWTPDWLKQNDQ